MFWDILYGHILLILSTKKITINSVNALFSIYAYKYLPTADNKSVK